MHEIGAALLTSIPPEVAQCQAPPLESLPRIMASCDAVIQDSRTGELVRVVEAKHRFPFAPPANAQAMFTYMGKSRSPQKNITCEQFAQCQMQMLVMDVSRCDLISYSLGGSRIFQLQRENAWLALALQMLQHVHTAYAARGLAPKEDAMMQEKPELYNSFLAATVDAMRKVEKQLHTDVQSAINRSEMSTFFLDEEAPNSTRRLAVGA